MLRKKRLKLYLRNIISWFYRAFAESARKRDRGLEQRVTRHDVDGHLWKGRIGVKHTLRNSKSNLSFSAREKKNQIARQPVDGVRVATKAHV